MMADRRASTRRASTMLVTGLRAVRKATNDERATGL
jgi:hypothetical protein